MCEASGSSQNNGAYLISLYAFLSSILLFLLEESSDLISYFFSIFWKFSGDGVVFRTRLWDKKNLCKTGTIHFLCTLQLVRNSTLR